MDLFDIVAGRQGGGTGGGTPQNQADWEQNDSSKKDYVKNRTHWKEEVEVDYLTLHYAEPIPGLGLAPYGRKIGLELNQTYNIEVDLEGQIYTFPATTSEMPKDLLGVVVPGVVYLYQKDLQLKMLDGIEGDFSTSTLTGTDNCYYTFDHNLQNFQIKIHGVKGTDTIYHKIPKEYIEFPEPLKIDQVFDPESENAQSGVSVKQAIKEYDDKLIVGTDALAYKSITNEKLGDGCVTSDKIAESGVHPTKLQNGISYSKIKSPVYLGSDFLGDGSEVGVYIFDSKYAEEFIIKGYVYFKALDNDEVYLCVTPKATSTKSFGHIIQLPIDISKCSYNDIDNRNYFHITLKLSQNTTMQTAQIDVCVYINTMEYFATIAYENSPFINADIFMSDCQGEYTITIRDNENQILLMSSDSKFTRYSSKERRN